MDTSNQPQTAEQINIPQTGHVEIPMPGEMHPGARAPMLPKSTTSPKQEGWWNLPDLEGSVAGVAAAIDANADIPKHWKEAIKAEITAKCGSDFNFVYVDAHCCVGKGDEEGNTILHVHITPDKKLV